MSNPKYPFILVVFLFTNFIVSASAEEPVAGKPEKRCLGLMQIDHIDIVDNQHILFQTKNGDYYINQLSHPCPTLNKHKAIMYKTPLNSLCDLDIITVLDYIGGGFQTTGACGLGTFKPATREEIEQLEKAPE